ncbi:hypothetical protein [Yersinia hibernica]|nr:hypothetical protein [Yersinia hibernica]
MPNKAEIKRPKEAPPAPPPHAPKLATKPAKQMIQRPKEAPPAPPSHAPKLATKPAKQMIQRPKEAPPAPPSHAPKLATKPAKQMMQRPKEAPPAPPVPGAANASQQGPATSVQNGSEPAKSDKMTQNEMGEAQRLITLATINFEIKRRLK